jgi:DNA-directed RNA polymerase subunit F
MDTSCRRTVGIAIALLTADERAQLTLSDCDYFLAGKTSDGKIADLQPKSSIERETNLSNQRWRLDDDDLKAINSPL